jgi:hypothetical protein
MARRESGTETKGGAVKQPQEPQGPPMLDAGGLQDCRRKKHKLDDTHTADADTDRKAQRRRLLGIPLSGRQAWALCPTLPPKSRTPDLGPDGERRDPVLFAL